VFPRTTNRDACVTLHSYHFYIEAGLPQTQVLLWVAGTHLRAAFDHLILAEYHCRYDWRDRRVKDVRQAAFHPTRFALPRGTLLPLTPPDSLVHLSRPGKASSASPAPHTAVTTLRGGPDRVSAVSADRLYGCEWFILQRLKEMRLQDG